MSLYQVIKSQLFPPSQGQQTFIPQFRLEGRPRDANTEEGLAMRIADPLWMLGRQWQFGEFLAEDNATPVSVKVFYRKRQLNHLGKSEADLKAVDFNQLPLEYCVENIPQSTLNVRQRVKAGQQLERLVRLYHKQEATNIISKLRQDYRLEAVSFENLDEDSQRFLDFMDSKVIDGQLIYANVQTTPNQVASYKKAWSIFESWYIRQFNLNVESETDFWKSSQLKHQFTAKYESDALPQEEVVLNATNYQSGHFDWYTFNDIQKVNLSPGVNQQTSDALLPVSLSFSTLPDKRLFTFEDNKVDLGSMDIEASDLLRLMLMNFSFISSNDWFTVPLEMSLGELTWVDKIEVKDAFGVKTIIQNGTSNEGLQIGPVLDANPLKSWDAFKIRDQQLSEFEVQRDCLLLAPVITQRQESPPVEEVLFLRDEYANMVWGLEKTVQNALGQPKNGFDQHRLIHGSPLEQTTLINPALDGNGQPLAVYQLASSIPFNWIPYLPVHLEGQEQEIELWRARMVHPGDAQEVPPLSSLILHDLERLREEAIPRAGARVQLTWQRIRWTDGKTYVWLGRKVATGQGEGSSGLRFDSLKNQETEHYD